MLKIRNSRKKILKISIMTFLVMISSFLFTNSINAEDLGVEITVNSSVYETDHFVSYTDIFYEYTIYETLKNYNIDVSNYKYIIINNYGGQRNIMIYLFNDLFTFIDVDNRTGGISKSLRAAPSGINYTVLKYNYDNTVERIGKYTSNGINSSSLANWYFNDGYFMLSLATSSRISYSNYDTGITGTYSSVQNVLTLPDPEPTTYEFNEVINTDEIRSIQLDFEIPLNSLGTSLDFSYNISSGKELFDSPYFTSSEIYCSIDETGSSSCTPFAKSIDWYLDYNFATTQNDILKNYNTTIEKYSHYKVNDYSYTLFDESKSVESISMFISFDTVNGFDVDIYFKSNLKFNIIYNYKSTNDVVDSPFLEDYYSTIDLTGKYGVAFLPQTNLDDSLTGYRTLFKADNLTDIQLRDNYDGKEYLILSAYSLNYCNEFLSNQNKIPYSCSNINGIFDFYINQDMDRQTLFFINKNYDNNTNLNITYDTRYYSYIIFETENSTGSVIRPGEEEETEIYIGYFYNYYDKYKNYELEHSFDIFLKPINFIFNSISDFYNYYCPPVFKSFLIISFTFVVSLILIKLFL